MTRAEPIWKLMGLLFKAHPWHGVNIGASFPEIVTTYIEITPTDTVKYELDKISGHLKVDRPQAFSNICPTLYGLVPQTFCGEKTAELCQKRTGRADIVGDEDPLDICVLSERPINARDLLLHAKVIGGLTMLDGGEADDKIVAVLRGDFVWGGVDDLDELPGVLVERLRHYFATYKLVPGAEPNVLTPYGKEHAMKVITASLEDYEDVYGGPPK